MLRARFALLTISVGKCSGSIASWISRESVASLMLRCVAMPTICFTSCAGGWTLTRPMRSPRRLLTESTLLDYIRFQTNQQPRPAAASINHRVAIAERALRREFPQVQPPFAPGFQYGYRQPSLLGC